MNSKTARWTRAISRQLIVIVMIVIVMTGLTVMPAAATPSGPSDQPGQPWSFGVIADTQWTVSDDGYNPNTTAANIIKQVDQQFIRAGVKLVVAVGDTVDMGSKVNIDTRALYAQDLYNAGIGFYPLRGNHEASEDPHYLNSGPEFRVAYPQIGSGVNNNTPLTITTSIITPTDLINNPPAARSGVTFTVGTNFSEPTAVNAANNSVSYAFRYGNATFMLLDQFDGTGNYYNSTVPQQQSWISSTLASRPAHTHAFVFSHKNVLGGNHKDSLFGGNIVPTDPSAGRDPGDGNGMDTTKLTASELTALTTKQTGENNFLASLQDNDVYYLITGHDHHHYASVITSPDGLSRVHQLITQSDSSKFYTPALPVSANDAPLEQDLGRVGYYIFTVDGPRVTVDYYGDTTGGSDYGVHGRTFHFVKTSTRHYSLNGKSKVVATSASYAMSDDTTVAATLESGFKGTTMAILSGTNTMTSTTNYGKALAADVNTAWTAGGPTLASDTLGLSGMAKTMGGSVTDPYVLSLTYQTGSANAAATAVGLFALLTRDATGRWVNAVKTNTGGATTFVLGPWTAGYGLGTYGVDTTTHTAWAVLNHNGDFAVGLAPRLFLPVSARH